MKKIYNLIIYLLRYFSIIVPNYKLSHEIDFGSEKSNKFFKRKLKNCNFYFEYGSGSSTLLAIKNKKKFISLEADKSFYNYLRKYNNNRKIKYTNIGPTKYFSYPILPFFLIKKRIESYVNYLKINFPKIKSAPDLFLIDGRFRVYVCLNIIKFIAIKKFKKKIIIIIDDYKYRKSYKILEKIFKVNLVGRFGVITVFSYKTIPLKKVKKMLLKVQKQAF